MLPSDFLLFVDQALDTCLTLRACADAVVNSWKAPYAKGSETPQEKKA